MASAALPIRNELQPKAADYFQPQESAGCGRHALNNFFKGIYFIKDSGVTYTDPELVNLDPATTDVPISLQSVCRLFNEKINLTLVPHVNICERSENYLIEVLQAALRICGYQAEISSDYNDNDLTTPEFKGYIINTGGHYISARYNQTNNSKPFKIVNSTFSNLGANGEDVTFDELKRRSQVSHLTVVFTGHYIQPFDTNIETDEIIPTNDPTNNCKFNKNVNYVVTKQGEVFYVISRQIDGATNKCSGKITIMDENGNQNNTVDQSELEIAHDIIPTNLIIAVSNYQNKGKTYFPSIKSSSLIDRLGSALSKPSYSLSSSSTPKPDPTLLANKKNLCKIYYEDWANLFVDGYESRLDTVLQEMYGTNTPLTPLTPTQKNKILQDLGHFCQLNSGTSTTTTTSAPLSITIPTLAASTVTPSWFTGLSGAELWEQYGKFPDKIYYDIDGFQQKVGCPKNANPSPCQDVSQLRICNKKGVCGRSSYREKSLSLTGPPEKIGTPTTTISPVTTGSSVAATSSLSQWPQTPTSTPTSTAASTPTGAPTTTTTQVRRSNRLANLPPTSTKGGSRTRKHIKIRSSDTRKKIKTNKTKSKRINKRKSRKTT